MMHFSTSGENLTKKLLYGKMPLTSTGGISRFRIGISLVSFSFE